MNISIIADCQLHSYTNFATVLPSGRNSRLQHGVDAFKFAVNQANGGVLVMLGDMFEDRKSIGLDVQDAAAECVEYASGRLKEVYLVVGNHDQYFRDGDIHSLRVFGYLGNVHIVDGFKSIKVGSYPLHMSAFRADPAAVKDWISGLPAGGCLCLHQAILGAEADGGHTYGNDDALTVDDCRPGDFDEVFVGHFHKPQSVARNVHYVGSPYQIKVNEAGQEKRIAVLTVKGGKAVNTWVPVTGIPTFRRITAQEFEKLSQAEIDQHFWEVEGELGYRHANARCVPSYDEKEDEGITRPCSNLKDAARSWMESKGHPEWVEAAIALC